MLSKIQVSVHWAVLVLLGNVVLIKPRLREKLVNIGCNAYLKKKVHTDIAYFVAIFGSLFGSHGYSILNINKAKVKKSLLRM